MYLLGVEKKKKEKKKRIADQMNVLFGASFGLSFRVVRGLSFRGFLSLVRCVVWLVFSRRSWLVFCGVTTVVTRNRRHEKKVGPFVGPNLLYYYIYRAYIAFVTRVKTEFKFKDEFFGLDRHPETGIGSRLRF